MRSIIGDNHCTSELSTRTDENLEVNLVVGGWGPDLGTSLVHLATPLIRQLLLMGSEVYRSRQTCIPRVAYAVNVSWCVVQLYIIL